MILLKNETIKDFVLKGNILYSSLDGSLISMDGAFLVCLNQKVAGVFQMLPSIYEDLEIRDMENRLIIPGMTDIHIHAPQYTFRGLGMDLELIQWLETNTFPEEAKYKDIAYAKNAYEIFVEDLKNSLTTRACVYATVHNEATILLMDLLEESGLCTYVGRVNMDRNCSEELCEESSKKSAMETEDWIVAVNGKYTNTKPIITPRFLPSCTDDLMNRLSELSQKYKLPVQSHLSENLEEITWVKELLPDSKNYSTAYDDFGMFGEYEPTIMAHCVHCNQDEIELMKKRNVFVAHCPSSNLNLSSGIAPVRKYLDAKLQVALGTDVAGGSSICMLNTMAHAIQVSKMYWRLIDQSMKPLGFQEAFYLATLGGGSFFGKVGSFIEDYEFDALVLDDKEIRSMGKVSTSERVERLMYDPKSALVYEKYVKGQKLV